MGEGGGACRCCWERLAYLARLSCSPSISSKAADLDLYSTTLRHARAVRFPPLSERCPTSQVGASCTSERRCSTRSFDKDRTLRSSDMRLILISVTCACVAPAHPARQQALQRAHVARPRVGGLPSMSVDPSFWQAKQSQARYEIEKKSALLDELMEREQVLIDQLFAHRGSSEIATVVAKLQEQTATPMT